MEALRRMVAAYKSLSSFSVKSEADIVYVVGQRIAAHQMTQVEYTRNPGRVALVIVDPLNGTQKYLADGGVVTRYHGTSNLYQRKSVGPKISEIVSAIDKDTPQIMSPLDFVTSGAVPTGAESARVIGKETIDGVPTIVVKGAYSVAYMKSLGSHWFAAAPAPSVREFTVWLEQPTYLVRKSSVRFAWAGKVTMKGAQRPVSNPQVMVVERVTELKTNVPIPAADFQFVPPRGSEEKSSE